MKISGLLSIVILLSVPVVFAKTKEVKTDVGEVEDYKTAVVGIPAEPGQVTKKTFGAGMSEDYQTAVIGIPAKDKHDKKVAEAKEKVFKKVKAVKKAKEEKRGLAAKRTKKLPYTIDAIVGKEFVVLVAPSKHPGRDWRLYKLPKHIKKVSMTTKEDGTKVITFVASKPGQTFVRFKKVYLDKKGHMIKDRELKVRKYTINVAELMKVAE